MQILCASLNIIKVKNIPDDEFVNLITRKEIESMKRGDELVRSRLDSILCLEGSE